MAKKSVTVNRNATGVDKDVTDGVYVRHPYQLTSEDQASIDFTGTVSRTKQAFKDECDINNILKRYQTDGVITHARKFEGQYADVGPQDFQEAMQVIAAGESMFEELPSSLRDRFVSPVGFLEFVNDESNQDEVASWLGREGAAAAADKPKEKKAAPGVGSASEPVSGENSGSGGDVGTVST